VGKNGTDRETSPAGGRIGTASELAATLILVRLANRYRHPRIPSQRHCANL